MGAGPGEAGRAAGRRLWCGDPRPGGRGGNRESCEGAARRGAVRWEEGCRRRPGLGGAACFLSPPISSQLTINTAIVYMHRFYMVQSFTQFHRNVSGGGGRAVTWGGLGVGRAGSLCLCSGTLSPPGGV